jgi:hypothetical protein
MAKSLTDIIDGTPFVGLAVTFVHTGFNASIEFEDGQWSPHEFATCASDAILKCFAKHAPAKAAPLPDLPPIVMLPPPPPY